MLIEESTLLWVWKDHDRPPSPRHQSDPVHTMLSVEFDKVVSNLMSWRYWHTHLFWDHSIHKHGVLNLHLVEILVPRRLQKIPHHVPDVLLDDLNSGWVGTFTSVSWPETKPTHPRFFFVKKSTPTKKNTMTEKKNALLPGHRTGVSGRPPRRPHI